MMKTILALLVAAVLLAAGCTGGVATQGGNISEGTDNLKNTVNAGGLPVAARGDTVSVYYTGKLQNGTVFDSNVGKKTLDFTVGAGQMIAGFDAAVVGMKEGQEKTVTLSPAQAYGERNEEAVVTVPLSNIQGGTVEVGTHLYANGMNGVVTEIKGGNATIDFNHELAGKTLVFTIKMVKITKKA
ncbi:FKBP-type peptidyl-prolyl cis-trans isomerase [uncultured archaeon]|nr:FKBP-type peptidyl-prolyl cis-trans isomerase [uncultured archaeon]